MRVCLHECRVTDRYSRTQLDGSPVNEQVYTQRRYSPHTPATLSRAWQQHWLTGVKRRRVLAIVAVVVVSGRCAVSGVAEVGIQRQKMKDSGGVVRACPR